MSALPPISHKRPYSHLLTQPISHLSFPTHPPFKRPRRLTTPDSIISAITTEEGDPTPSPPQSPPTAPNYLSQIQLPIYSPTTSPHHVLTDVANSFSGPFCPTAAWTSDLLVQVLANEVEDLIYSNEERTEHSPLAVPHLPHFDTFYSSYRQPFELDFYIRRLVQYVNCSTAVFVTMFVYLDRVQDSCKSLLISDMNCHRLIFTCLVLAIKYMEDEVHSNAYYARVGGLTIDEMNALEIKLLHVLQWNLSVSPETYSVFEEGLMQTASLLLAAPSTTYAQQ